jgi:transposase
LSIVSATWVLGGPQSPPNQDHARRKGRRIRPKTTARPKNQPRQSWNPLARLRPGSQPTRPRRRPTLAESGCPDSGLEDRVAVETAALDMLARSTYVGYRWRLYTTVMGEATAADTQRVRVQNGHGSDVCRRTAGDECVGRTRGSDFSPEPVCLGTPALPQIVECGSCAGAAEA